MSNVRSFAVGKSMKSNTAFVEEIIGVFKEEDGDLYHQLMVYVLEQFKAVASPVWHGNLALNVGMDEEDYVFSQFNVVDRLTQGSERIEIMKIQYKLPPTPVLLEFCSWGDVETYSEHFTQQHPDRAHGFNVFFYSAIYWFNKQGLQPWMLNEEDGVTQLGFANTSRTEIFIMTWNDANLEKDLERINGEQQ